MVRVFIDTDGNATQAEIGHQQRLRPPGIRNRLSNRPGLEAPCPAGTTASLSRGSSSAHQLLCWSEMPRQHIGSPAACGRSGPVAAVTYARLYALAALAYGLRG